MSTATSASAASGAEFDPRYPVGKFRRAEADPTNHPAHIAALAALPENLRAAIDRLSDTQLNTPYRDGGWTVRQLVHHLADSHMNACVRMRLALTEDWPAIIPYDEKLWAELPDASGAPVDLSLRILEGLHARWVLLLRSLEGDQWQRGYVHPQNGRQTLAEAAALYAWHCRHHVAHITELRKRKGW
jgi:DinB superfamily